MLSGKKRELGSVEIVGDGLSIRLKKAKIWKLTVRAVGELCFENCEIGEIAVYQTADYRIKNQMNDWKVHGLKRAGYGEEEG